MPRVLVFLVILVASLMTTHQDALAYRGEGDSEITGYTIEKVDFISPGITVQTNQGFTVLTLKKAEPIINQGERIVKAFKGIYCGEIHLRKEVIVKYYTSEGITGIYDK